MRNIINNNDPVLLVASTNPGKLREFQALLAGLPVRLVLPSSLGITLTVEETGQTYAENAVLKAAAYCHAGGVITLADDSGLEVDALGGAPGLHSARYSPQPGASDADRRALLLQNLLAGTAPRPWTARFRCVVAVAVPGGEVELADGAVEGEIIPEERGQNGFGYDPLFFMPELGRTMAELPEEQKNHLSHRGRAVQNAVPVLRRLLSLPGQ